MTLLPGKCMFSEVLFTKLIYGFSLAKAKTISAVLSVELSLTTTIFDGKTVCDTKDFKVKAINASSL